MRHSSQHRLLRNPLVTTLIGIAAVAVLPLSTVTPAGAAPGPTSGAAPSSTPNAAPRTAADAVPRTTPGVAPSASASASAGPATEPATEPATKPGADQFVRRVGERLVLAGRQYTFAGSNNYYPIFKSSTMVDALFDKAVASDFDVLRVWGSREIGAKDLSDSVDPQAGTYLQYWDPAAGRPAYNDGADGLEKLDYVIAAARSRGLRLVIPFVNNWNNFGGIDQYVRWAGRSYHDDFYTDPTIRTWYKAWINHLLTRVNPLTGLAYRDDPTVLMWELGNEPRCVGGGVYPRSPSNCTTTTLTGWADEMSTYVKSVDRSHLVGVGDEGFYAKEPSSPDWTRNGVDGVDGVALSSVRNVDVMGWHLYPDGWKKDAAWGTAWITEHLQDARRLHKPAFLGEFGLLDKGIRNAVYRQWTDAFVNGGGTGELYWILSDVTDDGTLYADYDGFTVYCPSPVCTTLSNAGRLLRHQARTFAPVADDDVLTAEFGKTASSVVTANDTAYLPGTLVPGSVDLDPATAGRQATLTLPGGAGTLAAAADGTVTYTPSGGYVGRVTATYTVRDSTGRTSGRATVTVIAKSDPAAAVSLFTFEDGTQGWAEQNWSRLGGTVTQTTAFATEGTHGARVDSLNEWFGSDFATPVDLSGKSVLKLDLRTAAAGTSLAVTLRAGSGSVWCQGAFTYFGANTTVTVSQDLLTGLSCEGGAPPDLTQVRSVYLFFNSGTFEMDNLRAE